MEKQEVRDAYDRLAGWYDWLEVVPELLGARTLRRELMRRATGRVLEVAVGTGRNLSHYPPGTEVVGVDFSFEMIRRAREAAAGEEVEARFALMDAERLAVRDGGFDTVTSSMTLCTFPEPGRALREMERALKPGGRILLVEHGRSEHGWIARYQDRTEEKLAGRVGCHWNREPLEIVRAAGLDVVDHDRKFLGVFHMIEAAPRAA